MSVNQENRAVMSNYSRWGKLLATLKVIIEYTNDYLSGNKHKGNPYLKREKQK